MPRKSWLDSVSGALAEFDAMQSLGNIQKQLDKVEFRKNPGLWMWTKPASLGIEALSQVGRPIAAAGGAVGGLLSEAASQQGTSIDDALGYAAQGAGQGWLEGDDTFKDIVSAVDVASLATGGVGGALARGGKAVSLARGLQKADLALSGADAALGAGNIYEGLRDKDWGKVAQGVFRVAGNTYSGANSLKDLRASGSDGIMAEAKPSRTKREEPWSFAEEAARHERATGPTKYGSRFPDEQATPEDHAEVIMQTDTRKSPTGQWDPIKNHVIDRYDSDPKSVIKENTPDGVLSTRYQQRDANGEWMTVEVVDDHLNLAHYVNPDKELTPARVEADRLKDSPVLSRFGSWVRQVVADGQNEIVGRLSNAVDEVSGGATGPIVKHPSGEVGPLYPGKNNPMTSFANWANFRGIVIGAVQDGWTYLDKLAARGRAYAQNRAFYLAPREAARRIETRWDALMDPSNRGVFATQEYVKSMSPEAQQYIQSVWNGGARTPELDLKFKAERFMYETMYTILHEAGGHSRPDATHAPGARAYRTDVAGSKAIVEEKPNGTFGMALEPTGSKYNKVNMTNIEPERISSFEPMHNEILNVLSDPNALAAAKGIRPEEAQSFYKLFSEGREDLDNQVKAHRDRVNSRREHKKANAVYDNEARNPVNDMGGGSTPPTSGPPGSSGGGPHGPQMQPIATRIKTALAEHQRAIKKNELTKAEINAHRADLLRKNEEALFSQRISHEDFTLEAKKIMSGAYDIIKQVDPLVLQGGDIMSFMQRIAAQANDDAFLRQRGQIAFDKMLNGERLESNEIQLMREIIGDRVEAMGRDPLYKRLGELFANATGGIRAALTSYDLSAAGRQALYGTVMNPREAAEGFKAQIQALRMTRAEFDSMMMRLQDKDFNPYAEIAKAAGLHFSESATKATALTAEEAFMNGKWAEKLPGVKQSEQAYIAYLNKLRVELFNKHMRMLEQSGIPLLDQEEGVSQVVRDVAYMVNTLTGRGEMSLFHMSPNSKLGKKLQLDQGWAPGKESMDKAHRVLTSVFFAPRFAASRAALMRDTVQAMIGGGLDPVVSRQYMKNVIGTIGVMTSVAGGLAAMGVGTFNADPRKKDFGVLKVGKTRYDLYGGLKPWAKITATLGADQYWSGRNRLPKKYGDGPMTKTKTGEVGRFVQSKLSPLAGFIMEGMTGEDFMGRKSSLWQNAYGHSVPMIAQTIIDLYNEDELDQLPFAVPAAVVGLGVNTYSERRFNRRDR